MASNPNIRVLASDTTAYKYDGTLECAAMLMGLRIGYIDREYSAKQHGFTGNLRIIGPAHEQLCEPGDWVIVSHNQVETLTDKQFLSDNFDLFFK